MSNIFSYQRFFQNEGAKYREEGYSGKIYFTTNMNDYRGNDYLKDFVVDLRKARGIEDQASEYNVMDAIAKENDLKKMGDRYFVPDRTKLNIGLLSSKAGGNPYILFRNVTRDVNNLVKNNIETTTKMLVPTLQWINKVRPKGEWDYKNVTESRFYVNRISDGKSGLFCLDGWNYKGTKLLRYDDVGNINYGATGKALQDRFNKDAKVRFETLLKAGGDAQLFSDNIWDSIKEILSITPTMSQYVVIPPGTPSESTISDIARTAEAIKLLFGDYNNLFSIENTSSMSSEKVKALINKVNAELHDTKHGQRNSLGDDPRDTFAIGWGYNKSW